MRTLGTAQSCCEILKDDKYPFKAEYQDFEQRPRWREFNAFRYHPLGLVANVNRHFAYLDLPNKKYDIATDLSLIFRQSDDEENRTERQKLRLVVEDYWDHLPIANQATFCRDGLIRYDDMLVIDEKGDTSHKFPHIFVDFESKRGPFAGFFEYLEVGNQSLGMGKTYYLNDWSRIEFFPKIFPEPKGGTVHSDKVLEFDAATLRMFVNGNNNIRSRSTTWMENTISSKHAT